MFHYEYVTKEDAAYYKKMFLDIIHETQDLLRDEFTFSYDFIGSSARNMITCDFSTNKGFDFDVNLHINDDDDDEYSPEELKHMIMNAINRVARPKGYEYCEDSTRVITLKKKYPWNNNVEYSCDFAIVYDWTDNGKKRQQYIRFQKNQNNYAWVDQTKGYDLEDKVQWIKSKGLWNEVRRIYLYKKNHNTVPDKRSRSLYAETINEVAKKSGY